MTVVVKPLSIRIVFCSLSQSLSSATHNTILMDFSVDLLHTVQKDIESEILKLMKAVSVSSPSDINQSSLNKLNKAPLQNFLVSIVSLYDKNVNLCKSAAVKCDQLQTEQIALQKQLLDSQNDQITSVQKTVQSEMKSWADVARKNVTQSKVLTAKTVKEAVRAVNEEEERSRNLIIYGVSEGEEGDWSNIYSTETLNEVVKSVHEATVADGSFHNVDNVYRLGKKVPDKTRPIKVEFISSSDVDAILKNAYKLKANSDLKSVYLSPDRTKEQRSAHGKLVNQMKEMIARDSSKHYFIRDNKINCVDKR